MDTISCEKNFRVTIQQIGVSNLGLFERQDDIASVSFFFFQAEDGIRDCSVLLEFRRVLFRSRPVRTSARSPGRPSPLPRLSSRTGTPGVKYGSPTRSLPRRASSTTTGSDL